jgi:hypothetical protein
MFFNFIYRHYKERFYDKLVEQFIGEVPDTVREPVLDFLADKRVLFEKFLSIQAYHIQKARIQSKKSPEFYDGALVIIKAFLTAVNQKVVQRTTVAPVIDETAKVAEAKEGVDAFLKGFSGK